jgi:hypothetical protein
VQTNEVARALGAYSSVVLSYVDANAYPRSLRCVARFDQKSGVVLLDLEAPLDVDRAKASLLGHAHDEQLWNMTSVLVRGHVERRPHDGGHVFVASEVIPGIRQGLVPFLRFVVSSRRRAAAYLRARNLPRPPVPWDRIAEVRDRVFGAKPR